MNVLLSDINLSSKTMPPVKTVSESSIDSGDNDFHSMMQENLQLESKSGAQLTENNGVKANLEAVNINLEQPVESSLIPDFWVEHLAISDTSLRTEASPVIGPTAAMLDVKSASISPNAGIPSERSGVFIGGTLSTGGEILPVNGGTLPSNEQFQPVDPAQNIWVKSSKQDHVAEHKGLVQNMLAAPGNKGVTSDSVKFEVSSQSTANSDSLDQLSAKLFESNLLQQTASDSPNTRLQASMNAISGLQNPSINLATANPLSSSSVLSGSLERMALSNPENATEWSSGLGERVSLMLNQKQKTATIRLDPPMLGKMEIQILVKDDVTSVTINTQHAQTRDMVDSASYRLREFLQDAGYQNVNVDVSHQSDQQKNNTQSMTDADKVLDGEQSIDENNDSVTVQLSPSNSLVDYFA